MKIDSPSPGTVVEIRTAPSADPELADTKVVAQRRAAGRQDAIELPSAEPSQYLIVWVTQLGGQQVRRIGELSFIRAGRVCRGHTSGR